MHRAASSGAPVRWSFGSSACTAASDGSIAHGAVETSRTTRDVSRGARRDDDITERSGSKISFAIAEEDAIGRLAGGITHDFNNFLTALIGYTELALSRSATTRRCIRI